MKIERLDHLVLTVADIGATCDFYRTALGMEVITFGEGRTALRFGNQKINLHEAGREVDPKAERSTPGSGDLCFITGLPLDSVVAHLKECGVEILLGPVPRHAEFALPSRSGPQPGGGCQRTPGSNSSKG